MDKLLLQVVLGGLGSWAGKKKNRSGSQRQALMRWPIPLWVYRWQSALFLGFSVINKSSYPNGCQATLYCHSIVRRIEATPTTVKTLGSGIKNSWFVSISQLADRYGCHHTIRKQNPTNFSRKTIVGYKIGDRMIPPNLLSVLLIGMENLSFYSVLISLGC